MKGTAVPSGTAVTFLAMLVLYDGVCGFCDASVQWLLRHDTEGRLTYAPLQGETAAGIRAAHPELPRDLDSIVLIDGTRAYWRSEAIFRILQAIPRWRFLAGLRVLPRPLTDLGYRFVAAVRLRIWGRLDACRVPSPAERARFLP